MGKSATFVDGLLARGKFHFTFAEACGELGSSIPAVRAALRRLKEKGRVVSPHNGFFVIVPPEYRAIGCLPANQFIHELMTFLNSQYYVGLLSAAELHGAAHQRPQTFQIMVKTPRRTITCGGVKVQFFVRKALAGVPTMELRTDRGPFLVSTPEATALDLMGYTEQCGGIDNVVPVVSELAEALDPTKLRGVADMVPTAWVQRLGYLLERTDHRDLTGVLVASVDGRAKVHAPLVRGGKPSSAIERNRRWKILVNATLDEDS